MGCCIALALVIAVVRRARNLACGSPTPPAAFAPPARRPTPGQAMPAVVVTEASTPRSSSLPAVLAAVGATWFLVGIIGMHVFGLFEFARCSLLADVVLHGSGLLLLSSGAAMWLGTRLLSNDLQVVTR